MLRSSSSKKRCGGRDDLDGGLGGALFPEPWWSGFLALSWSAVLETSFAKNDLMES